MPNLMERLAAGGPSEEVVETSTPPVEEPAGNLMQRMAAAPGQNTTRADMPDPAAEKKQIRNTVTISDETQVPLVAVNSNYPVYEADQETQKKVSDVVKRYPYVAAGMGGFSPFITKETAPDVPFHPTKIVKETGKGVVRFFEGTVGGTLGGTAYDWLGQFIEQGGLAVDQLSKLGSKNKNQIYNPFAESIIATGQNISTWGKASRQAWAEQASTGWEALDEGLKEADPVTYYSGKVSEGVASSALSVLAMYLSGGASAAPELLNKGFQINRGLLALSGLSAAGGFEHAQAQNENFLWSTVHGLADGGIEYAMETGFLEGVGEGGKALSAGAKEGLEEFATGMLQNTRAGILENNNAGMTAYEGAKDAVIKALRQAPLEVVAGFVGGFGIQGGGNLAQTVATWRSTTPVEEFEFIKVPVEEALSEEVLKPVVNVDISEGTTEVAPVTPVSDETAEIVGKAPETAVAGQTTKEATVTPEEIKSESVLRKLDKRLDEAEGPIDRLNALQKVRTRLAYRKTKGQVSPDIESKLNKIEEELRNEGYEIDDLKGQKYVEGMTVNATFVADDSLADGEMIIKQVHRPQIMKDGVLIQAADITVAQGWKTDATVTPEGEIALGVDRKPVVDTSLRELSDEQFDIEKERAEKAVEALEDQISDDTLTVDAERLMADPKYRQDLADAQDRLSAIENEDTFRNALTADIDDVVDEIVGLRINQHPREKVKAIALIEAIKERGAEKELQQAIDKRSGISADERSFLQSQLEDIKKLGEEIKQPSQKVLPTPAEAQSTQPTQTQKKGWNPPPNLTKEQFSDWLYSNLPSGKAKSLGLNDQWVRYQELQAEKQATPVPTPKEVVATEQPGLTTDPPPQEPQLPGGRQAGAVTFIPDLAAEIHSIGRTIVTSPVELTKAVLSLTKRNFRRAITVIGEYGNAGKLIAKDMRLITKAVVTNSNNDNLDIAQVFKGVSKPNREVIAREVNKRNIEPQPPWIKERADKLRTILDRSMQEARALGMERSIKGTKIPVGGKGNAFPQVPNKEGMKFLEEAEAEGLRSRDVFAWATEQVKEGKFKSVDSAIIALQGFRESQLRGVNRYLETERVELPVDMVEWDGAKVLPHIIEKNWMTVEGVRKWGVNFERIATRTEQISKDYGRDAARSTKSYIETAFGISKTTSVEAEKASNLIRGFQFITKIGSSPLTTVRNMLDRIVKGFTYAPLTTIKTFIKYPPFINQFIGYSQRLEESMIRRGVIFGHGTLSEGFEAGSVITELASAPFTSSERGTQTFIALVREQKLLSDIGALKGRKEVTDVVYSKLQAVLGMSTKQIESRLRKMGGQQLIDKIHNEQEVTQEEIDLMLHEAVRDNAFPLVLTTKPLWYDSHPFVRILAQFKTWPVNQTNLIWQDVIKYTYQTGDPTRLLGFLTGTLFVGELYNILRDFLLDKDESVLSKYRNDATQKELAWAAMNDLLDGGVVGMLADFTYGISDWVTGVSFSTGRNVWGTIGETIKHPTDVIPAIKKLIEKEVSGVRQAKGLANKIDAAIANKNNIVHNHTKWRARGWDWQHGKKNPTISDKVRAYADTVMFGPEEYRAKEDTLAYELAARQIVVGDVSDAAVYLTNVLKRADNIEDKLVGIKISRTSKSPLGKIPEEDMQKFLSQFPMPQRIEALATQDKYMKMYNQAIVIAIKNVQGAKP